MSSNILAVANNQNRVSPIYGIPTGRFTIADLNTGQATPVPVIGTPMYDTENSTAGNPFVVTTTAAAFVSTDPTTTATGVSLGARSVQILVAFASADGSCQIDLLGSNDAYAAPIATFQASLKNSNGLYVGRADQGFIIICPSLKVKVSNIQGTTKGVVVSLLRTS